MPDSKIHLFPTLALFLAPNHDFSPITIINLVIHYIANYNFSATAHTGSSKMAENRPHFLRPVAIPAVHPVYIYIVGVNTFKFFLMVISKRFKNQKI